MRLTLDLAEQLSHPGDDEQEQGHRPDRDGDPVVDVITDGLDDQQARCDQRDGCQHDEHRRAETRLRGSPFLGDGAHGRMQRRDPEHAVSGDEKHRQQRARVPPGLEAELVDRRPAHVAGEEHDHRYGEDSVGHAVHLIRSATGRSSQGRRCPRSGTR